MSATPDEPLPILLVEDDADTAVLEQRALSRANLHVMHARSVAQALTLLGEHAFSVIFLDYHLPDGDAWAIVRVAQARLPPIPVVLVTAMGSERIAIEALQHGIADYVSKQDAFWNALPAVALRAQRISQAELKLRQTEAMFRMIADTVLEMIVVCDERGVVRYVSPACKPILGYEPAELLGKSLPLPEALDHPGARADGALLGSDGEFATGRYRRKDGTTVWLETSAKTGRDPANGARERVTVARDISARRRAEEALVRSEMKFRTLVNHAPVGIFETDTKGSCTFVNATWSELTGISLERALGTGWLEALHPDDRERTALAWNTSVASGNAFELDYRFRTPLGVTASVNGRAVALRDPDGALTGYLGTVIDVTERTLAAERIQKALAEKEVLLREIHHRVKNNLQVIMSLVRLQSDVAPHTGSRALLDSTRGRIHAIALLHERLYRARDLSHIGVRDYLSGLIRDVVSANGQDRIQLEVTVSPEQLAFDLDTAMPMGLIVNELLTNAFKHAFPATQAEGRISVRVSQNAAEHEIVIEDDGVGFPSNEQAEAPNTLGLQIVRSLSEQLDATLRIESGRGVRWLLTFPVARGRQA